MHPKDVNATIHVACSSHQWPTTTESLTTTTTDWMTTTTDLPLSSTTLLSSPYYEFTDDDVAYVNSDESYYQDEDYSTTKDDLSKAKGDKYKENEVIDDDEDDESTERVPNHLLKASRLPELYSVSSSTFAISGTPDSVETDSYKKPWGWSAVGSTSPTPGYYLPAPTTLPGNTPPNTASTSLSEPKASVPDLFSGGTYFSFPPSLPTTLKSENIQNGQETQPSDKKMADMKKGRYYVCFVKF